LHPELQVVGRFLAGLLFPHRVEQHSILERSGRPDVTQRRQVVDVVSRHGFLPRGSSIRSRSAAPSRARVLLRPPRRLAAAAVSAAGAGVLTVAAWASAARLVVVNTSLAVRARPAARIFETRRLEEMLSPPSSKNPSSGPA